MRKSNAALLLGSTMLMALAAQAAEPAKPAVPAWVGESDKLTKLLLDVDIRHSPETASQQGLAQYDKKISDPRMADDLAQRKESEAALAKIVALSGKAIDTHVLQDVEILKKAFDLRFRREDYRWAHEVEFINVSSEIFQGLRVLLDDQVDARRRPAALDRLRKYTGVAEGTQPFTELVKQRVTEQMDKPGVTYPWKDQIETELSRNSNYVDGIEALFKKYGIKGWEEPFAKLKTELADYDAWLRATVLPKARADFRLPPEEYALNLENYGVGMPPDELAGKAHAAFAEMQGQMQALATEIAKEKGYPDSDYRAVIRELKKEQITGDAILPFYLGRLKEIETIITDQKLITLPNRPAIIRLASAAETAQQPAPHMTPPAFLHNTGERGEFVLPLNIPSSTGESLKYDDFTSDSAAWTLTAHEARPGHELQFDKMVELGTSKARALYAFNSANAEGWGLYSEYIMQPYEPKNGQIFTLQLRLQRAARAFLDPELESGKITQDRAFQTMEKDVVLSHAMAKQEVERYTYRAPGQATSYFYGYIKLLALRKETEDKLGAKFDQKKFHDFILAQGLLPPDLLAKAVREEFVPAQL